MIKRNPVTVAVLTLLTFGVYAYYWLYRTTDELKEETGRDDLNPLIDLLLAIVTVGFWGIYAGARNAKIAHEEMVARGHAHSDRSLAVGATMPAFEATAHDGRAVTSAALDTSAHRGERRAPRGSYPI